MARTMKVWRPGKTTMLYSVEVQKTIYCTIEVEADTPEEAITVADKETTPLPKLEEWSTLGYEYAVYDGDGNRIAESE